MDTTKILLEHNPRDAIVMMLNLENGTNFAIDDIEVSAPVSITETDHNTLVTLKVRNSRGKNDILPYGTGGEIEFRYNRLDVAHHFNGVLGGYNPPLPTSTQILLDEITARVGQAFTLNDIVLEDIGYHNVNIFVLKSKVESLRWIGQMPMRVGEIIDLGELLPLIAPPELGALPNADPFVSLQAIEPFLNTTAHQALLRAVPLNTPSQNNAVVGNTLKKLLRQPNAPKYRPCLYSNSQFVDSGVGWSVNGDSRMALGSITFSVSQGAETAELSRSLSVLPGDLLEVVVHIADHNAAETGQLKLQLLDAGSLTVLDEITYPLNSTGGFNDRGVSQAFFISPIATPLVQLKLIQGNSATPLQATVQEFRTAHFSEYWRMPAQNAAGVVTVDSSSVNTVGNALPIGRSTVIEFTVSSIGSHPLTFTGRAPNTRVHAIEPNQVAVGQLITLVINHPAVMDAAPDLLLGTEGSSWVLSGLTAETLPLPWLSDAIPTPDAADGIGSSRLIPTDSTDATRSIAQGYLTVEQLTTTPGTLRQYVKGLPSNELFQMSIRSIGQLNRFVDITIDGVASGARLTGSQGAMVWNPAVTKRFKHPIDIRLEGNSGAPGSNISINITNRDAISGNVVSIGTYAQFLEMSCRVESGQWGMEPFPTQNNLYGAQVTTIDAPIEQDWNSAIATFTHYAAGELDLTRCTNFTVSDVYFPYIDFTTMTSSFARHSQLTRYGLSTVEDASYYVDYISSLEVGQSITVDTLPAILFFDSVNTDVTWVNSATPAHQNLNEAIVQYNGPIRSTDLLPVVAGLDSVLVLFLSPIQCTNYRGSVRFYYRT